MPIHRSGPTPPFCDYVCKWGLADPAGQLPQTVAQLNSNPLRIPSFQRGISWGAEEVINFLRSDSVLFGNIVIGMFPQQPGVLVDGLQRFATGTALLSLLYARVLSPTPSNMAASPHFVRLKATVQNFQPVFSHNHGRFVAHPRHAIRVQYAAVHDELEALVDDWLSPANVAGYAQLINTCFLDKQVAIDEYWNFRSEIELANTFIGLNTVRVELGTVDLIRAYIVDKATSCPQPWAPPDIADAENEITDAFTEKGQPAQELLPAATVVLKCLQAKDNLSPTLVFPNWAMLPRSEVERFLDFVDRMCMLQHSYVTEIKECGHLPFGIVLLFYYRQYLSTGNLPGCLSGTTANDAELHVLLRAAYRAVVDGTVGRLGSIAEDAIRGTYQTLDEVARAVANQTGSGPLAQAPDANWLRVNLRPADSKKAKRIFNACLLPDRTNDGGSFLPVRYSRRATDWQIDHLIPSKNLRENQPGYQEGHTLRNLAPLLSRFNRAASNTPCSQKFAANGVYDTCSQTPTGSHPYISWLRQQQASYGPDLDKQELLEVNATPRNIGDERIEAIIGLLLPKL